MAPGGFFIMGTKFHPLFALLRPLSALRGRGGLYIPAALGAAVGWFLCDSGGLHLVPQMGIRYCTFFRASQISLPTPHFLGTVGKLKSHIPMELMETMEFINHHFHQFHHFHRVAG